MLVVEGADGSGKTTLVKKIQEHFGFEVGKRGTADRDFLYTVTREDTHRALADAVLCKESPVIWDRLFYSDFVYAPVQGRPIAFLEGEADFIQNVIEALQCPLIICHPPLDVVEANITQEKQMSGVSDNIAKIWRAYRDLFKSGGPYGGMGQTGAMWWDYTGTFPTVSQHTPWTDDVGVIFQHIEEYLDARREREPWTVQI